MTKFKALGLNETLLQAITDLGFETPSEVQEKAIPVLLDEETDLIALAQTGTGKTAAFGFPYAAKNRCRKPHYTRLNIITNS